MLNRTFLTLLVLLVALPLALSQLAGSSAAGGAPAPVTSSRLAAAQSNDFVWVEDSVPAGAQLSGTWNWIGPYNIPTPVSGFDAHRDDLASGVHQHYFHDATERMAVNPGDVLIAYVYLDPTSPPTQVMLQWNDGTWDHRAYWAASPSASGIPWGLEGTTSRRYMGPLPPVGQWVRLEVPAAQVGLEGVTVHGMAFTLFDGTATWDRAGKYSPASTPTPTPPPTANYRGSHDLADCNVIAGWAQDMNSPSTRLSVSVYDDATGGLVATATANLFRQDLVNAGIGDGYHGFSIPTPAGLKDGLNHTLRVKVTGTSFSLWNTPKVFNSTSGGCTITPTPTPTPGPTPLVNEVNCKPRNHDLGPCHLQQDLHWAMAGVAGPAPNLNWEDYLDWTYNRWRIGSSENWGPIAHAISLWKPAPYSGRNATLAEKLNWWNTFLQCQTGKACSVPGFPDVKWLRYMKGSELSANNYDAAVMTAVVAVHYWATKVSPNQTLANNARAYLRATFAMYTLAAGREWATKRTYYYNFNESEVSNVCHTNNHGALYFMGPFLALAGMRSTPAHICQDDRAHVLIRALQMAVKAEREPLEQEVLFDYMQANWPGNSFNENVYALSANERTVLIGHKNSGTGTATLFGMLGAARTSAGYNFLGWNDPVGGQVRATLMERNNNHQTVAIYGIKYTQNTHEVHVLFPWAPAVWRDQVTKGKGELRPVGSANPTTAWATNFNPLDPDERDSNQDTPEKDPFPKHGVREVSMPLPTSGKLYHIRLRPDGVPQCLSGSGCQ